MARLDINKVRQVVHLVPQVAMSQHDTARVACKVQCNQMPC